MTKTVDIARTAMQMGTEHNKTLFSFIDVVQVFQEYDDQAKVGKCYSNLGCIMIRLKNYEWMVKFFDEAIAKQRAAIKEGSDRKAVKENQFLLACRLFQRGFASFIECRRVAKREEEDQ